MTPATQFTSHFPIPCHSSQFSQIQIPLSRRAHSHKVCRAPSNQRPVFRSRDQAQPIRDMGTGSTMFINTLVLDTTCSREEMTGIWCFRRQERSWLSYPFHLERINNRCKKMTLTTPEARSADVKKYCLLLFWICNEECWVVVGVSEKGRCWCKIVFVVLKVFIHMKHQERGASKSVAL